MLRLCKESVVSGTFPLDGSPSNLALALIGLNPEALEAIGSHITAGCLTAHPVESHTPCKNVLHWVLKLLRPALTHTITPFLGNLFSVTALMEAENVPGSQEAESKLS